MDASSSGIYKQLIDTAKLCKGFKSFNLNFGNIKVV